MRHFFLTDGSLTEASREVTITGEDARHIALALRARVGDTVMLADGTGLSYTASLAAISPTAVRCTVTACRRATVELPLAVHLFVGYPKGDKLELVIEKAVELGAREIIIVGSTSGRLDHTLSTLAILDNNSTGVTGVNYNKNKGKWSARICFKKQEEFLGVFNSKQEAIIARLRKELEYFGAEQAPQRHLFAEYNITSRNDCEVAV